MKIDRLNKVTQIYKANQIKSVKAIKKKNNKDSLVLSDFAKDFQTAKSAVYKVPDVRKEKIEQIRKKMNGNNYNVDSKEIAKKMTKQGFDCKI